MIPFFQGEARVLTRRNDDGWSKLLLKKSGEGQSPALAPASARRSNMVSAGICCKIAQIVIP